MRQQFECLTCGLMHSNDRQVIDCAENEALDDGTYDWGD